MDVRAAQNLVDFLAAGVRGFWPGSTRDAWTEQFMALQDTRCAERAVRLLVETWKGDSAPSYGVFKSVYDQEVHYELQRRAERTGLPSGHKRVSLLDYLISLTVQAEDGDTSAAREVEDWRKFLRGPAAEMLPDTREAAEWLDGQPPLIDS